MQYKLSRQLMRLLVRLMHTSAVDNQTNYENRKRKCGNIFAEPNAYAKSNEPDTNHGRQILLVRKWLKIFRD